MFHLPMLHFNLQAERSKGQASRTVVQETFALLRCIWEPLCLQVHWHVPVCRHVWMANVLA